MKKVTNSLLGAVRGGHSSAGRTGAGRGAEAESGGSGRCAELVAAAGTAVGCSDTLAALADDVASDAVAVAAGGVVVVVAVVAVVGDAFGRGRYGLQLRFSAGQAQLLGRVFLPRQATRQKEGNYIR